MEGLQQSRRDLLTLLEDSSRHVDILSPLLEPSLLDNEDICTELTRLARRGRQSRVRVIVGQHEPSQFSGHHLMILAQRLPTTITMKVLPEHPEWNGETVVVVDESAGLLVVPRDKRQRLFSSRAEAQRWSETFNRLWVAAQPSVDLRRLS